MACTISKQMFTTIISLSVKRGSSTAAWHVYFTPSCSWAGPVQLRSDCSPVHAAQGSTISGRLLHAVLRRRQSSMSSLRQPPSARRATTLPEQVWSSGLLRRRPRRLELSTCSPSWPVAEFWLLQAASENSSLHGISVTLVHYGLCEIALYKFTCDTDIIILLRHWEFRCHEGHLQPLQQPPFFCEISGVPQVNPCIREKWSPKQLCTFVQNVTVHFHKKISHKFTAGPPLGPDIQ